MIPVYFATNRDLVGTEYEPKFGDRFHVDGPQFYRVGFAEVDKVSDDPDAGYQPKVIRLMSEPAGVLGSSSAFGMLHEAMQAGGVDALVYIHGFASSFESALARGAQLAETYLIERADGSTYSPRVFVFSWPSNGRVAPVWNYFSDRDDAEASGKAMARALLRLVDWLAKMPACGQRLHLVAHSMGNYALRWAVQGLRSLQGDDALKPIFDNVFLMAADEDEDALEPERPEKLGLLPRLARRIHVYHAIDDGALKISDKTKGNPDRLGTHGPRSFSGLSTRIQAIDCSAVDRTPVLTHLGHQYYRLRPEVIRDVRGVLSGLQRAELLPGRETIEPGRRYALMADEG